MTVCDVCGVEHYGLFRRIHCPICKCAYIIESNMVPYDEQVIINDMTRHIRMHGLGEVLDYLDTIWSEEYNKHLEEMKHESIPKTDTK